MLCMPPVAYARSVPMHASEALCWPSGHGRERARPELFIVFRVGRAVSEHGVHRCSGIEQVLVPLRWTAVRQSSASDLRSNLIHEAAIARGRKGGVQPPHCARIVRTRYISRRSCARRCPERGVSFSRIAVWAPSAPTLQRNPAHETVRFWTPSRICQSISNQGMIPRLRSITVLPWISIIAALKLWK